MVRSVKTPRRYDATRRREQAGETRRLVLAAATRLFIGRGYAATTMADVAAEAGVAVQTVYSSVGGKAALLKEVFDVAIAGDDEPVPMMERPEIRAVQSETDGRRKLELYAAHLVEVQERIAPLHRVLQVAADADPEVDQLRLTIDAQKQTGMTEFARDLKRRRLLRRGVTVAKAADVLVAHMDAAFYLILVEDCGWSSREYQRWYVTVTAAALLVESR